ncbi:uncharacterized protein [Phaseolus vulgaris]|uniref:uncharacterized protein isoform X3 n=1 Tax=Phaseolus vulgaris TaxID=3885 RepID=UPI0035CC0CCF
MLLLKMKFLDWYLKIGVVSALVGASMEVFMIKTGFYDKVTVLESEKRAWENSPDAQAIRQALNPWRQIDSEERKRQRRNTFRGCFLWHYHSFHNVSIDCHNHGHSLISFHLHDCHLLCLFVLKNILSLFSL